MTPPTTPESQRKRRNDVVDEEGVNGTPTALGKWLSGVKGTTFEKTVTLEDDLDKEAFAIAFKNFLATAKLNVTERTTKVEDYQRRLGPVAKLIVLTPPTNVVSHAAAHTRMLNLLFSTSEKYLPILTF
jgi:hypothetical protein